MTEYDHIKQLQAKVVARLQAADAKDYFQRSVPWPVSANGQPIAVLSEEQGDINFLLTQSLERIGVCLAVLTPTGEGEESQTGQLRFDVPVVVQIQEDVTMNRAPNGTQVQISTLIAFVLRRLHGWSHALYPGSPLSQMVKRQARAWVCIDYQNPVTYNVAFTAPLNLSAPLAA